MILYYSNTSPFSRKVLLVAHVCNMIHDLELVDLMASGTYQVPEDYVTKNPLLKVPALDLPTSDLECLMDSPVICEFLHKKSGSTRLYPIDSHKYFYQKKLEALADGLCDAAVLRVLETRRPRSERSPQFDLDQSKKINNVLSFLESQVDQFHTSPVQFQIGEVSIICALGYLDLRFPHESWTTRFPRLADWFDLCKKWNVYQETAPKI